MLGIASPSQAGLADWKGNWDLDSTFEASSTAFAPLNASSLVAGGDYSFGTAGGYTFLQTQPFTSVAKRLTATNPTGPNGGPGATRTNQWSIVMDVRFDAFQPFSGILQLDPTNATDVSFYIFSSDNVTGTLASTSATGAFSRDTWYRLALTCGNNGAGGALTIKCYINGVQSGTPRASAFNGSLSMAPTFHLFTDNTPGGGDLKPAKLGSLALWGEELTASDIASLGGPQPYGIFLPGQVNPASPPVTDGTIDPAAPYAHGANIGWVHARPSVDWGLVIGEHACSGFAHGANVGWINFGDASPADGIRYTNTDGTDYGVNHDGRGNLSGLAWGANIGWINFGTDDTGTARPTGDTNRPRFDLSTGQFSGYAYGANVGWINLSTLRTATMASPDSDGDGLADAWEREKFTYLSVSDGTTDSDGDGLSDKAEYLADTDPADPNNRLRIISHAVQFYPGFNSWEATFTSSPRRLYRMESSLDLGPPGSWADATGPIIPSQNSTTTFGFATPPAAKGFLRVAAFLPLQP